MNVQIDVVNDLFEKKLHDKIFNTLRQSKWTYNGGSKNNPFWHADFLEDNEFFSKYLHDIIVKKFNIVNSKCIRIYANGQTAGMNGEPHIDDGHVTFLYFANQIWNVNWDGHLAFLNTSGKMYNGDEYGNVGRDWMDCKFDASPDDEIEKVITYKPNRGVLFPSNLFHYAMAPHRFFTGLRMSLAYKFFLY